MTYDLYCIVNAAGTPYDQTFRASEEWAIRAHIFALEIVRVEALSVEYAEEQWADRQTRCGDRCVPVRIETQETVKVDILS